MLLLGIGVPTTGPAGSTEATFTAISSNDANTVTAGFWAVFVTAGASHTCGMKLDGSVWCWGANGSGQLGNGTTTGSTTAVEVKGVGGSGTLGSVSRLETGPNSSTNCVVRTDATAACWGENSRGQSGDGTTTDRSIPVEFKNASGTPMADVTRIAPGLEHTCLAKTDGTVWCVGRNDKGQLGNGGGGDSTVPVQVAGVGGVGTLAGVTAVASGEKHTCAVRSDTSVVCWGQGDKGQLGNAATSDSSTPVVVKAAGGAAFSGASSVTAGKKFACVVSSDTAVWCWGENNEGQLGDGTTTDHETAAPVPGMGSIVDLGVGAKHSCSVETNGTTSCWGDNPSGQLGNATTNDSSTPVSVVEIVDSFVAATGAALHSCGLDDDAEVWCWGENSSGELGIGTTTDSKTAKQVRGVGGTGRLGSVSLLEAGPNSSHTCAIKTDATAVCWGLNGNGRLGDGTTTDRNSPVVVKDGLGNPVTDIAGIAPGKEHTCLVKTDGTAWCVGRNDKGQLGNNTTSDSTVPVQVVGVDGTGALTGVSAVSSGEKHTCAVRWDTSVACWGQGDKGQLGNAATADSSKPVVVQAAGGGAFGGATTITAGKKFACTITSDTAVWCWGENNEGQLGHNTTSNASTPVQVRRADLTFFTGAVQIDGGEQHACARTDTATVYCWGRNDKGQLGDGTTTDKETATQIPGMGGIVDLGVGAKHSCSVENQGTTWCWGVNANGQLGNATVNDSASPVRVKG